MGDKRHDYTFRCDGERGRRDFLPRPLHCIFVWLVIFYVVVLEDDRATLDWADGRTIFAWLSLDEVVRVPSVDKHKIGGKHRERKH